MRNYNFEIDGSTFSINEGPDLRVNGRAVTEWEVRKVCQDQFGHEYYHQYRSAYLPRRATKVQMRSYIERIYVQCRPVTEDEYNWAA